MVNALKLSPPMTDLFAKVLNSAFSEFETNNYELGL